MKIVIISTIRDMWGGSEELWANMAHEFLENDSNKMLHVSYENKQVHPKLLSLQSKGLIISTRPGYIKPNSSEISKLLQIGINFLKKKIINPLSDVKKFKPDVVIYNGTCYSIAKEKELIHYINNKNIKFYIIGHLNSDSIREINDYEASIVKNAYSICQKVFFVSNRNKIIAERHLCTNINNAFILKNPVNLNKIAYITYPQSELMLFAMVGNLNTKHKGQDIVLSILSEPNWRNQNWRLNIYGTGTDEQYLNDLINHYGLADKVILCGSVTDINALWTKNQVLLMPSHMEGMALAIVEAMICGRLVIATDVGGSSEWISNKTNGFIAEAATKNAFEKAMLEACAIHTNWEQMGKDANIESMKLYDATPGKTLLKHLN